MKTYIKDFTTFQEAWQVPLHSVINQSMPLQSTDNFLVDRAGYNYKVPSSEFKTFSGSGVITSTIAPSSPIDGQLWYDPNTNNLYVWNGEYVPFGWIDVSDPKYITYSNQRNISDKLADFISVTDFGAVGDGVKDDTSAIQAAINSCVPWKKLYIPQGNYLITSRINIPSNENGDSGIIIYGDGTNSTNIITNSNEGVFYSNSGRYITIRDIHFNLSTKEGVALEFYSDDGMNYGYFTVIGCGFSNCGIAIRSTVPYFQILNNIISDSDIVLYNCAVNGIVANNRISLTSDYDDIVNTSRPAIRLRRAPAISEFKSSPVPNSVQIFGNTVTVSGRNNVGIGVTGGKNISVYNNKFDCTNSACPSVNNFISAIHFARVNTSNVGEQLLENIRIINNHILAGNGQSCIRVRGHGAGPAPEYSYNIWIENNVLESNTDSLSGIFLENIKSYLIEGNVIQKGPFPQATLFTTECYDGHILNNRDRFDSGATNFKNNYFPTKTLLYSPLLSVSEANITPLTGLLSHQLISKKNLDYNTMILNNSYTYTGSVLHTSGQFASETTLWQFCLAKDSVSTNFIIYGNGDFRNKNGVYAGFSDVKLKMDIQDAESQLNKINSLKPRNYKLKNSEDIHFGLVAQEVELHCKDVVFEDSSGLKSINYSGVFMKSFKALQEVMNKIETMESEVNRIKNYLNNYK